MSLKTVVNFTDYINECKCTWYSFSLEDLSKLG